MTTIAVDADGRWIAADGKVSCGGAVERLNEKKLRVQEGKDGTTIYALAGTTCMFEPLIQWHKAGADPAKVPPATDVEWCLMVIDRTGSKSYSHRAAYPERITYPFTTGTGREYALGAIKAGVSAERAVEIACEIDIHSGGEIQVVNIKEALGMAPQLVKTA